MRLEQIASGMGKQFRLFTTDLLTSPPVPNLATSNDHHLKFIFLPILAYRLHLLQMPIPAKLSQIYYQRDTDDIITVGQI